MSAFVDPRGPYSVYLEGQYIGGGFKSTEEARTFAHTMAPKIRKLGSGGWTARILDKDGSAMCSANGCL